MGALVANPSHLRTSHGKLRGERIKQVDTIEKLILRIKGLRWRQLALLGFVLVGDLLDLPTVDAQTTCWQDVLGHLVPQARLAPAERAWRNGLNRSRRAPGVPLQGSWNAAPCVGLARAF